MPKPIPLTALLDTKGVIGAARWQQAVITRSPSPPQLIEYVGEISEERAERLIAHAEAAGLAVFGISQLSYQRASSDKTVVYPVDSYYVHGQYTSVIATINAVAILLDNKAKIDVQALINRMILVDNS